MRVSRLPDLLAASMPQRWKDETEVAWRPIEDGVDDSKVTGGAELHVGQGDEASGGESKEEVSSHPPLEWIRSIWEYIRGSGQVAAAARLCDGWPCLPARWDVGTADATDGDPAEGDLGARDDGGAVESATARVHRHLLSFQSASRLITSIDLLPAQLRWGLPAVRSNHGTIRGG